MALRSRTSGLPRVPWAEFLGQLRWRQGEHVSLIGPTNQGKTTLGLALLPQRSYTVVLGTKPKDATLAALRRKGYYLARDWPGPAHERRVLLWPRNRKVSDVVDQQRVFAAALEAIYTEGGWCVFADELRYLCDTLRLEGYFEQLWQQGRSIGISLMAATQRPAHVPLFLYDQATHLFFWRDNDEANLKRIGGIGWLDSKTVRHNVAALAEHDVLYINTRRGEMAVTRVAKEQ